MNKVIGYTMLTVPFVVIAVLGAKQIGWIKIVMIYIGVGVLLAWIFFAVSLLK